MTDDVANLHQVRTRILRESLEILDLQESACLVGIMFENPPEVATAWHGVSLTSPDVEGLLVRWLNELNYLVLVEQAVPASCSLTVEEDAQRWLLEGKVGTAAFDREKLSFQGEVKSATYHGLEITREGNNWHARVVLDV